MTEERTRFTSNELIMVTGITLREMQYWSEQGILQPDLPGTGSKRWFDREDMVRAMAAKRMRARHFATRAIRDLLRRAGRAVLEALAGEPLIMLVTFKGEYLHNGYQSARPVGAPRRAEVMPRDQVIDWMKKETAGCFAIALDELAAHVHQGTAWLSSPAGRRAVRKRPGEKCPTGPAFRPLSSAPGSLRHRASGNHG